MNNTVLTILSLSASGSVIALILLFLRPLYKDKVTKAFQYYIWLLVLLRLALPLSFDGSIMNQIFSQTDMVQAPAVSTPADSGNGVQGDTTQGSEQTPSGTPLTGNATPDQTPSAAPAARVTFWTFAVNHLTAIWLMGALVYFSWFVIAYLRFVRRIRKTSVRPHAEDREVFYRLRGHANVRLACNPYIDTPMLIGFLSPCIVIPQRAFAANGKKSELRHILRHELTHYRRRDLLYKWFAVCVSALHWFNPLMVLVRREIGRACELSCDEAVIRCLDAGRRNDYGETLLSIASNKRLPRGVVTTTMCEEKRELKERLESIMTFKRKNVFMVALSLVLALSIAGCSMALGSANSPSPDAADTPDVATTPDAAQSPAPQDTPSAPASPSSLDTYKAVLQNEAEFYSIDNKKNVTLHDFLTDNDPTFNVKRFTVLDMDGDSLPEIVLELSVGDNPYFFEVLHATDGAVAGYMLPYRGMEELKADGTIRFSSGAADNGWGTLRFDQNAYTIDVLGQSESSQDDAGMTVSYFINTEQVAKEAYDSFSDEQFAKDNAVWHAFSQENIDAELSE